MSPAYAWLITSVILVLVFSPILLKKFNIFSYEMEDTKKISKDLLIFGLPLMLTMVGGLVISYTDTLMLTYFRSLSEVGIYNVILPTALLLLFVGSSLGTVMFPIGSDLWARKETKKLSYGLRSMIKYAFLFMVPVALSLIFFAEIFLKLFFGPEYAPGANAFRILIVGVLFYAIGQINNSVISGIGRPRKVTQIVLIAAVLNVVINLFAIPAWGIEGAALATMCSYISVTLMSSKQINNIFGLLKSDLFAWLKIGFGGALFLGIVYFLRSLISINIWLEIILVLIVASVAYVFYLFGMKKLNLGCGRDIKEGYCNLDKVNLKGVDVVQDLESFPWDLPDNEFDEVYCSHVLEHVGDLLSVMEEIHRVCKDGAKIKILVPYFSAQGSFNDPTHKRFFTYRTFEYFGAKGYYSKAVFKTLKRRIFFFSTKRFMKEGKLSKFLNCLINFNPIIYQRFFCWVFLASEINYLLEVKK